MQPLRNLLLLALGVVLVTGCKKKENNTVTPDKPKTLAAKLGTTRNWHGHYYASGTIFGNADFYYNDTSFALTVIDSNNINIFNTNFAFERKDTVKGIIYFGTAWFYYWYQSGTGVAYFYDKDSLVYCSGDISGIHSSVKKTIYYTY